MQQRQKEATSTGEEVFGRALGGEKEQDVDNMEE